MLSLPVSCARHLVSRILTDPLQVRYTVPAWFPGSGWRKRAAVTRKKLEDVRDLPHEYVKQEMVSPLQSLTLPISDGAIGKRYRFE